MGDHHRMVLQLLLALCACLQVCLAGHKGHHHNQGNRLIELLTAGIVAKVLQKNDDHEGGGGHHGYYAVPIPVHSGHHHSHHSGRAAANTHVTEKIIPIPVPHHTTRIIHINAGSHGVGGEGGGFNPNSFGGYGDNGGGGGGDGYGDSTYDGPGTEIEGGDYHQDDRSHHSPTIQQIMFHDGGLYGMPQTGPRPVMMRRPVVGMVQAHPAMPVRMTGMMPHPVMAAAHHPMVRVRHYYPMASGRHRMLAYPPPMMPYMRYRPPPMPYQTMVAG